ncbi:MAG: type IV pilus modification PilV family protein [Microbacteriaceae bacterium]
MKAIRARLQLDSSRDSGLSLIEVIVALLIFGIVAIGVGYSLASILTLSNDARSRVVAANIASEYIDNARSVENVFNVVDNYSITRTVSGKDYYVRLETGWINSTDTNAQCGAANASGAGALEYKRVNVEVTWDGMRDGTKAIRSDTLIAPNSRINDPTLGTIVVSAENALGRGSAGITVTTTPGSPANGAVPVTNQGLATDSDGCSYVLKVVPGNYNVTLTRTNYIGLNQVVGSITANVTVVAGGSALAKVSFDASAAVTARFPAGSMVPSNLQVTYSSTYGDTILANSNPTRVYPTAYQLIAGTYDPTGCKAPDPAAWPVRAADGAFGARIDPVSLAAGSSTNIDVPVGVVTVTNGSLNGKFITAVLQPSATGGNPGCSAPVGADDAPFTKYTFNKATANTANLALPYGTYKLYFGTTSGATTTNLVGSLLSNLGIPLGTANQTVTVDPRMVY